MKKIVSFVNVNFQQGPKEFNAHYLPYSVGILWSYAQQFPIITENYELGEFLWRRDDIDVAVDILKHSDVVGFSCYVWNRNYSYTLARELKKIRPDMKIIFGGPEPAIEEPDFFEKLPFIDIMVKSEGEISFKKTLEALATNGDLTSVPGLLINDNTKIIDTGKPQRINELDDIPSPYLMGYFDKLMAKHPDVIWNTTLETNRGCPYACTFCDWGSLTYNKVKKFGLERVFDELEWVGKNKCGFINIADANFGIFPERDKAIAEKLVEVQAKYGYPNSYTISWAKNQRREVIDIVKTLISSGYSKLGLNLSVQSLNEGTLEAIKRKNLAINEIGEVFKMCEQNNIPLYTELILGMPGETMESWKANFWKLFKAGNHTGVTVYQAQLLENAEMNLTQREEYGLEAITVYDYLDGANNFDELKEGIKVVVATDAMPKSVMLDAVIFSWFLNTFHINGITTFLSRFMYERYGVEYESFYEKLYEYVKSDSWLNNEMEDTRKYFSKWMHDGEINHPKLAGVNIFGVNLIHRSVINIHASGMSKHVFDVLESFMKKEFSNIDVDVINQLVEFQRNYLINHTELASYPRTVKLDYDFLGYMQQGKELNKETTYTFDFTENKEMSLTTFCEQIFFARRKNFGKAWVKEHNENKINL
jgi:tRNA A37 methylthiotransferase MiaB